MWKTIRQLKRGRTQRSQTTDLGVRPRHMTLAEFGIDKEEFFKQLPKMADDALTSGSPQNTRRAPNKEEIIELYKALW